MIAPWRREYDVLIRGATLYDGTGAAPRRADVALRGDRIARVSAALGDAHAPVAIDASGLALAPGFIDVHTHDDFALVVRPEMDFKILGGVTTVVVGNCGFGAAPFPMAALMARMFHPDATLPEWNGYAGYLAQLEREPASTNAAVLIGHGTVRASVMGNEKRAPTRRELEAMKAIVREGRDAGAVGLSSGLVYEPGQVRADRRARRARRGAWRAAARSTRRTCATRARSCSTRCARRSRSAGARGVPVQISHHKAAGADAWGLVRESLALIERAQAEGLDVHADQYPYTAGSTSLAAIVPERRLRRRSPSGLGTDRARAGRDRVGAEAPRVGGPLDRAARRASSAAPRATRRCSALETLAGRHRRHAHA